MFAMAFLIQASTIEYRFLFAFFQTNISTVEASITIKSCFDSIPINNSIENIWKFLCLKKTWNCFSIEKSYHEMFRYSVSSIIQDWKKCFKTSIMYIFVSWYVFLYNLNDIYVFEIYLQKKFFLVYSCLNIDHRFFVVERLHSKFMLNKQIKSYR